MTIPRKLIPRFHPRDEFAAQRYLNHLHAPTHRVISAQRARKLRRKGRHVYFIQTTGIGRHMYGWERPTRQEQNA
jgi:hypothetical protein